ncbi:MAG: DUF732 domain-containing protein [Mycobacterium sp.]
MGSAGSARRLAIVSLLSAACAAAGVTTAQNANADAVAYLVNVTMRPGYNFPGPDAAIAYGNGLCGRVAQGLTYPQIIGGVKSDFNDPDEYQAVYLVNQAVNELCPAQIWALRNSAAHYTGPTPPAPFPQA